jgi:hypothetical protein
MNISEINFKLILEELKNVKSNIEETPLHDDKLYFFTASFGVIYRVINIESNPTLIFIHQILQSLHQAMQQRLNNSRSLPGISNSLPNEMWNSFIMNFNEFIIAFESKNDMKIYSALENISNLIYATSGNGFYLYLKGKIIL